MALCIPLLGRHWGKKSKISVSPKRQPLCSSEYLEDHPSPPEAATESLQRRAPTVTPTMSSSHDFIATWADAFSLSAVIHTEWTEGLEENFFKDKWFGRQLLLYYQAEKMAGQFQSLKGIDLSETQRKLLDRYPYSGFCQRLGLLDPAVSEIILHLDPQPEDQELFEAYVGITQRHIASQQGIYQDFKDWLSDLESYTHPYPDNSEKEALSCSMLRPTGRNVEPLVVESMSPPGSVAVRSLLQPALSRPLRTLRQPAFSAPYAPDPSAPPAPPPTASLQNAGVRSPTVLATDHRRNQIQELSTYTSRLIQYGIDAKVDVRYDPPRMENASPSLFNCRVYVGDCTAEGSGTTKKEAKHKASEAAFMSILYNI